MGRAKDPTKGPWKLEAIEAFWDEHVGELPDNGRNYFGNWNHMFGREVVMRAIEKCSEDDALETSEDVLQAVKLTLRAWAARKWCP